MTEKCQSRNDKTLQYFRYLKIQKEMIKMFIGSQLSPNISNEDTISLLANAGISTIEGIRNVVVDGF